MGGKILLAAALIAGVPRILFAGDGLGPQVAGAAAQNPAGAAALAPDQIDGLTSSIALLPDTVVTQILYAAMDPVDVVLAQRWLADHPNATRAEIDAQPWHPSVRALAAYPSMINMMNDRLAWMKALGGAFVAQPKDVMQSIQRLRAQAQAVAVPPYTPPQTTAAAQPPAPSTAVVQSPPVYQVTPVYPPAANFTFSNSTYGYPNNYGLIGTFPVGPTVVIVGGGSGGAVGQQTVTSTSMSGGGNSAGNRQRGPALPYSTPVQSPFAMPRPTPAAGTRGR